MAITKYQVLRDNVYSISETMDLLIADGWQPVGAPFISGDWVYQTVIQGTLDGGGSGGGGDPVTIVVADISDATELGATLMQVTTPAEARTAIGAGTSSLSIGTTATTAAAGNHTHAGFASASDLSDLADRVEALETAAG